MYDYPAVDRTVGAEKPYAAGVVGRERAALDYDRGGPGVAAFKVDRVAGVGKARFGNRGFGIEAVAGDGGIDDGDRAAFYGDSGAAGDGAVIYKKF